MVNHRCVADDGGSDTAVNLDPTMPTWTSPTACLIKWFSNCFGVLELFRGKLEARSVAANENYVNKTVETAFSIMRFQQFVYININAE